MESVATFFKLSTLYCCDHLFLFGSTSKFYMLEFGRDHLVEEEEKIEVKENRLEILFILTRRIFYR